MDLKISPFISATAHNLISIPQKWANDIKHLGTFLFDNKIYNFDLKYISKISNSISDKILSST